MDKCKDKRCPPGKICNPATGRCVDANGKIGKNIKRSSPSPKLKQPTPKRRSPSPKLKQPTPKRRSPSPKRPDNSDKCYNVQCVRTGMICNPATGRCVHADGKIGKNIKVYKRESPPPGRDERKETQIRLRRGNLPDSYKLSHQEICSLPFKYNDREDKEYMGNHNRTFKIYTLEELYKRLQDCGKSSENFLNRIETNNKQYINIISSLSTNTELIDIIYINHKRNDYWLLLTPQLKGKDYEDYLHLVEKLYNEDNDKEKTRDNLRKIFLMSIKYPSYSGIIYFLQKVLLNTPNLQVFHDVNSYLSNYKKLYTEMIDLLTNIKTEFYSKVVESDNPRYYTIKAGTIFYRGVSNLQHIGNIRDKLWLAYDKINANNYTIPTNKHFKELYKFCDNSGGIGVYRLTKDIIVPNMENYETVLEIKSKINNDKLRDIFNKAFYANIYTKNVRRKSYILEDARIVKWMCVNGIIGFTAGDFKNTFYSELFLCNPKDIIEYVGYYDLEDLGLHICKPEYVRQPITL